MTVGHDRPATQNHPCVGVSVSRCFSVFRAGRHRKLERIMDAAGPQNKKHKEKHTHTHIDGLFLLAGRIQHFWTRPAPNKSKTIKRPRNTLTNGVVCWPVVSNIRSSFRLRRARCHRKLERILDAVGVQQKRKSKRERERREERENRERG